jgi:DNA-binding LacI/PurR family transcriptional regulator
MGNMFILRQSVLNSLAFMEGFVIHSSSELSHLERVYQDLKQRIVSGEFGESGKLPSLRAMESSYGASTGSIRQALMKLGSEHLVTSQHGRGFYVNRVGTAQRVLLVESGIHDHLFSEYVNAFQGQVSSLPSGMLQIVSAEPCSKMEMSRPAELLRQLDMHLTSGVDVCFFDGEKAWGITPEEFQALQQRTRLFYYNCAYPHFLSAGVPGVSVDWYVGAYRVLRHFVDIGCRNVICAFTSDTEARRGALDAVKDSGSDVKLHFFDPRFLLGDSELYELIQRHEIDGLFASSDLFLLGSMDLFRACGYAEDEVAMLGTFDTPWSRLLNFKLSSLNVRPMEMVQQVWDMYTGKIPVGQMKLQPELIFRDSTTAFRGGRNK